MSNIFENKGTLAATIVVAAFNSLNRAAANYVCDGTADDVEINAALAALPVTGGKVLLLEGNYTTIANITVPANATLEGQSKATIITPTGAAITNGIVLNGDNITLKNMKVILAAGAGTTPGFRPNVVYATGKTLLWLEDLWLVGDTTVGDDTSDVRQNGIYLVTCTYCKVVNCQSQTNKRHGICLYTNSNYNSITGNTCQENTMHGINLNGSHNCTITGNTCESNGGATTYSGIHIGTSRQNVITGNLCGHNGLHGISVFQSSYCTVTGNVCHENSSGDGINVTGDATTNADYNTITGNVCTANNSVGIEIVGGVDANFNMLKGNDTMGNTGRGVVDAGTNTIFDQVMHSIALDLTGGATDIEVFFAKCPCILAGYSIMYSIATGAGAGVNIRVGRYQDGVALDDDYFDISVSEVNKNKGYSIHFASAALIQTVIAAGDTITVGTAGGKADTGSFILILEIADMGN